MPFTYFMIPAVTALIGWGTNVIAVKMLFRPRQPVRLLGLLSVQGVIPRRKMSLARSVAEVFEEELLSSEEIGQRLHAVDLEGGVGQILDTRLDAFVEKLKEKIPMAGMLLTGSLLDTVRGELKDQICSSLPELKTHLASQLEQQVNVQELIEQKVLAFSTEKMEALALRVARRELRSIELLGGLLGFLIGVAQVAVLLWI